VVSQFTFHSGWGQLGPEDSSDLVDFWVGEKALPNEQAARQRLSQVVMFARDADGKVAAVCTALPQSPPQLGQPVYFYRSFVAPQWRKSLVVYRLLKQAVALLEEDSRPMTGPASGCCWSWRMSASARKAGCRSGRASILSTSARVRADWSAASTGSGMRS
jgi:hypothetical protein